MKKKKSPYVKWFPRIPPKLLKNAPKFEKNIKHRVFDRFSKCLYQNVCMGLNYDQKKFGPKTLNFAQKIFKNPKFGLFGQF